MSVFLKPLSAKQDPSCASATRQWLWRCCSRCGCACAHSCEPNHEAVVDTLQGASPTLCPCHSLLALAMLQEQEMPRKLAEAAVRTRCSGVTGTLQEGMRQPCTHVHSPWLWRCCRSRKCRASWRRLQCACAAHPRGWTCPRPLRDASPPQTRSPACCPTSSWVRFAAPHPLASLLPVVILGEPTVIRMSAICHGMWHAVLPGEAVPPRTCRLIFARLRLEEGPMNHAVEPPPDEAWPWWVGSCQ